MPKKKSLYRVHGDGYRYVLANSFADAEKQWVEHMEAKDPDDPDIGFVSEIEMVADSDALLF